MQSTVEKIKSLKDPYLFEELCCHSLLLQGYMVNAQGRGFGQVDGGKDAILTYGHRIHIRQGDCKILPVETYHNDFIVACFSINKNYFSKIIKDQKRLKENKKIQKITRVIFCTSQEINVKKQDELRTQSYEEFGWILDIYDPITISDLLDNTIEGRKIRKQIFDIDIDEDLRPSEFRSSFHNEDRSTISSMLSYTRNLDTNLFDLMCREWNKTERLSYTDLLFKENITKVQLTNVWYELSLFLVRETKTIYRGMSNDLEIRNFWGTDSGDLYYQINTDLVRNKGVKVKRIIIMPDIDEEYLTQVDVFELLKSCLIQEQIGCEIRLVPMSHYRKHMPLKCNYFAIQDKDYLLMCDVNSDCAYIQKDAKIVKQAIHSYEEFFSSESNFSFSVSEYMDKITIFPEEIKKQIIKDIHKKAEKIKISSMFIYPFWQK